MVTAASTVAMVTAAPKHRSRGSSAVRASIIALLQDHMFAAFVSKGIVDDLTGYYNKEQQK